MIARVEGVRLHFSTRYTSCPFLCTLGFIYFSPFLLGTSLNRPSVMAVQSSHTSSPVKCSSAERSTTFVTAVQMDPTVLSTECAREDRNTLTILSPTTQSIIMQKHSPEQSNYHNYMFIFNPKGLRRKSVCIKNN